MTLLKAHEYLVLPFYCIFVRTFWGRGNTLLPQHGFWEQRITVAPFAKSGIRGWIRSRSDGGEESSVALTAKTDGTSNKCAKFYEEKRKGCCEY